MSNPFDKLHRRVLEEVERQRQNPQAPSDPSRARMFGLFLQESLRNLGYSPSDFAQALDVEPELADAILDGILPSSEIDDAFLADIAHALNYDPNTLKIILNPNPVPLPETTDSNAPSYAQSQRTGVPTSRRARG